MRNVLYKIVPQEPPGEINSAAYEHENIPGKGHFMNEALEREKYFSILSTEENTVKPQINSFVTDLITAESHSGT